MPYPPYHQLIDSPSTSCTLSIAETSQPYQVLSERHLQAIWLEQKYFKSLTTSEGIPIYVLSPGAWNGEAGPDFLKAHLFIGEKELRGDIELHLRDESWYHHKHHSDPRYNNVVLHLALWPSQNPAPILNAAGHSICRSYFKEALTIPESRIAKLIDLDLYPYKHFVGSGRCAKTLFQSLSEKNTLALFGSAAIWRLKQKRQHLLAKSASKEDSLLNGIAMALGYKQNAENFFELLQQMKSLVPQQEQTLFAYALNACGFFADTYQSKWTDSLYYQSLKISQASTPINPSMPLRQENIRPANNPIRRLAILAKIATDAHLKNLESEIKKLWLEQWDDPNPLNQKTLYNQLLSLIPAYTDPYWQHHYNFEKQPQKKSLALLGNDLKNQIFLNVFLPLLYEDIENRGLIREINAFQDFYAKISTTKTRKSIYLGQRFFGNTDKKQLLSKAVNQQGAYQIHKDFCINYEASCVGCPFVERYRSFFKNPAL